MEGLLKVERDENGTVSFVQSLLVLLTVFELGLLGRLVG